RDGGAGAPRRRTGTGDRANLRRQTMKDLHSHISAVMVACAALAADNTPAAIDLQGFTSAEIILAVGIGGITFDSTNKVEFKLTHSDDDSSYSAVAAD